MDIISKVKLIETKRHKSTMMVKSMKMEMLSMEEENMGIYEDIGKPKWEVARICTGG